jgi:DivIVA domain-containing protein
MSFLSDGYHRKDVDAFANRLVQYFQDGTSLSVEEVRTTTFRQQKGGYREAQVDLLLDTVVDVMLAVR